MAAGPPPPTAPWQQQPYSVQLDPESARRLATNGATILLLDVPEATPIGLDQQVGKTVTTLIPILLCAQALLAAAPPLLPPSLPFKQKSTRGTATQCCRTAPSFFCCDTHVLPPPTFPQYHKTPNKTGLPNWPQVQGHQDVASWRPLPQLPGPQQQGRSNPQPPRQHVSVAAPAAGPGAALGRSQRGARGTGGGRGVLGVVFGCIVRECKHAGLRALVAFGQCIDT